MTEADRREARALLHHLWGRHASGEYVKSVDKPDWARLDVLLGPAAKLTLDDIKKAYAADLEDP